MPVHRYIFAMGLAAGAFCWTVQPAVAQNVATPTAGRPAVVETEPGLPLALTDGRRVIATLIDWDEAGPIFNVGGGPLSASSEAGAPPQPVSYGAHLEPVGGTRLLMIDGSLLCGEIESITPEKLSFISAACRGDLPLTTIRGIVLHPPRSLPRLDELLIEVSNSEGTEDRLWLGNGDRISGVFQLSAEDQGEVPNRNFLSEVPLRADNQLQTISSDAIHAIGFSPILRPMQTDPPARYALGLASDGSWLECQGITVTPDRHLRIQLACGAELHSIDRAGAIARTIDLWCDRSAVERVASNSPIRYRHLAYLSGQSGLGVNRTSDLRPIRTSRRRYASALAMRPTAQATFQVPASASRLQAEVAVNDVDASSILKGSVRFRVLVETDGKLEERYASPIVRGGEPPVPIDVPLNGGRLVVLIVDWADQGAAADEGLWLEARWIP